MLVALPSFVPLALHVLARVGRARPCLLLLGALAQGCRRTGKPIVVARRIGILGAVVPRPLPRWRPADGQARRGGCRCHGPFRTGPGGGLGAGVPCGAVSGAACAACSVVSIAPMLRVFDRSRRRCSARAACSWRGGAAVSIAPSASAWQRACRRYALEGGWHGLKPGSISGRLAGDGFPSARESQSLFSDPDSGREKRRHEAAKFSEAKCA